MKQTSTLHRRHESGFNDFTPKPLTIPPPFLYLMSLDQPKPENLMALATGTKAPDFSLSTKTADGPKQVRLSDNFGKTNTLLLFFPMAFTGTCTTEMCSISKELPDYSGLNAAVYGISGDNPFAQEAWANKESITVPLLSDYEHKVAKEYDVMYDSFLPQINLGMGGVPKRSAFIIDRDGVIQYAESNDDARELPNFDKIKAKLAELK